MKLSAPTHRSHSTPSVCGTIRFHRPRMKRSASFWPGPRKDRARPCRNKGCPPIRLATATHPRGFKRHFNNPVSAYVLHSLARSERGTQAEDLCLTRFLSQEQSRNLALGTQTTNPPARNDLPYWCPPGRPMDA